MSRKCRDAVRKAVRLQVAGRQVLVRGEAEVFGAAGPGGPGPWKILLGKGRMCRKNGGPTPGTAANRTCMPRPTTETLSRAESLKGGLPVMEAGRQTGVKALVSNSKKTPSEKNSLPPTVPELTACGLALI